jgi:hypothetical protein
MRSRRWNGSSDRSRRSRDDKSMEDIEPPRCTSRQRRHLGCRRETSSGQTCASVARASVPEITRPPAFCAGRAFPAASDRGEEAVVRRRGCRAVVLELLARVSTSRPASSRPGPATPRPPSDCVWDTSRGQTGLPTSSQHRVHGVGAGVLHVEKIAVGRVLGRSRPSDADAPAPPNPELRPASRRVVLVDDLAVGDRLPLQRPAAFSLRGFRNLLVEKLLAVDAGEERRDGMDLG